VEKIIRKAGAL